MDAILISLKSNQFLLGGLIIGFVSAAPLGPIGVLCIRRALSEGGWAGFASGMGTAVADVLYSLIAIIGLTFVAGFLAAHQLFIWLISSSVICAMGIKTFFSKTHLQEDLNKGKNLIKMFVSTFLLTLANPTVILTFAALLAAVGATGAQAGREAQAWLIGGIIIGAVVWWGLLNGAILMLNIKLNERNLRLMNKTAGVLIVVLGLLTPFFR
ncbi:MAG: LysE family transporter [Elusimicrobia bacterium]|nr:LysE family transporter [Elusimicrobiota bacterium]